jgi:hypothetical protein
MALDKFKAPALPAPPKEYDQNYMSQLVRALGNYFVLLDSQAPQSMNNVSLTAVPQSNDFPPATLRDGTGFQLSGEDIFRIKVAGVTPVPVANTDYVDAEVAAGVATAEAYADANFVNLAGDTMTGNLALPILNATTTNATTTNATNVNATNVNATNVVSPVMGGITAPGMVLQVQQAIKTDTFTQTTTGNTYYPVPGLSVNITPKSATSKILVTCVVNLGSSGYQGRGIVFRDSTPLGLGNANGLRTGVSFGFNAHDSGTAAAGDQYHVIPCTFTFLDSPASISSLTYSVSVSAYNTIGISVNRSWAWQNTAEYDPAFSSTITVMEIAQ